MEVKLSKYRVVSAETVFDLQEKMNALAELGYIHKDLAISAEMRAPFLIEIMGFDEGNYEGVDALRDIAPELVTEALAAGWSIASSSISTKFVRMIRRKKA